VRPSTGDDGVFTGATGADLSTKAVHPTAAWTEVTRFQPAVGRLDAPFEFATLE
jgi:hypothetical protein